MGSETCWDVPKTDGLTLILVVFVLIQTARALKHSGIMLKLVELALRLIVMVLRQNVRALKQTGITLILVGRALSLHREAIIRLAGMTFNLARRTLMQAGVAPDRQALGSSQHASKPFSRQSQQISRSFQLV